MDLANKVMEIIMDPVDIFASVNLGVPIYVVISYIALYLCVSYSVEYN